MVDERSKWCPFRIATTKSSSYSYVRRNVLAPTDVEELQYRYLVFLIFGDHPARGLSPENALTASNEGVRHLREVHGTAGRSRQGAPDRKTQKMPLRTLRSFTRGTPRGLFGSIGLMAVHS